LSNAINNDPRDFKLPWRLLYMFSLRHYKRLDALRCVSKSAAEDFEKSWGVPSEMIYTIYPAFDLKRIYQRAHSAVRNNAVPVVCSIGRLTSQKDFSLLIHAFAIARKYCAAKLKIGGIGPEMGELQALVNRLGLQNDIMLLGFVDYAEEVIASSDLFVMTSVWEGFPATLIEAMVLGTAVISVDCQSGPSEIIEHEVNGLLVKKREPEDVADAMLLLMLSPNLRGRLSENALLSVERFSLKNTVLELENILSNMN
jgi:glycosyltransferase involved in cell wall biosynthesis